MIVLSARLGGLSISTNLRGFIEATASNLETEQQYKRQETAPMRTAIYGNVPRGSRSLADQDFRPSRV